MRASLITFLLLASVFCTGQSLQNLIPTIEQRPRQITDTLNRDYDNRVIEVSPLPNDLAQQYTGEEFDYTETTQDPNSFLSQFFDWFFGLLGRWFGIDISPFWATVLEYFVYLLFAAIAIYILIRLLTGEKASGVTARGTSNRNSVTIEETHIEQIDLNRLIKDAVDSGNYRNAVRYLYLNSLKKLSAAGKIDWDFQKTNGDYYREIKNEELRSQFQKVSYLYDYIWYGEFMIDEHAFAKAQLEFNLLNQKAA